MSGNSHVQFCFDADYPLLAMAEILRESCAYRNLQWSLEDMCAIGYGDSKKNVESSHHSLVMLSLSFPRQNETFDNPNLYSDVC
jgi:hypothetical protein